MLFLHQFVKPSHLRSLSSGLGKPSVSLSSTPRFLARSSGQDWWYNLYLLKAKLNLDPEHPCLEVTVPWSTWQLPCESRVCHIKLILLKLILVQKLVLCVLTPQSRRGGWIFMLPWPCKLSNQLASYLHYIVKVTAFSKVHTVASVGKEWPWLVLQEQASLLLWFLQYLWV